MKKIFIPITSLLLLAGNVMAADNSNSAQKASANSQSMIANAAAKVAYSYEMLMEENIKLRTQAEVMTNQMDELNNKLGYSQMMYTTLNNLNKAVQSKEAENLKDQVNYANMMHVTITNLAVIAATTK